MPTIDPFTILLVAAVAAALLAALCAALLLQDRRQANLGWHAASYGAAAIACLSLLITGTPAPGASLAAISAGSAWVGLRGARSGQLPYRRVALAVLGAVLVCLGSGLTVRLGGPWNGGSSDSGWVGPDLLGMTGLVCSLALLRGLHRNRDPGLGWSRLLRFAAGLHAALVVATLLAALTRLPVAPALGTVLLLESLLHLTVTGFGLLALLHERAALHYRRAARHHAAAAQTDALTGACNRRGFLQQAETTLSDAAAHVPPVPAAVLLLDLDHFKRINDTHGHAGGDAVLQLFAQVARAGLRSTDLFGRLGGEEFAALLPDITADQARGLGERIRQDFAAAAAAAGLRATVSVGVALAEGEREVATLLRGADQALYLAKAQAATAWCCAKGRRCGTRPPAPRRRRTCLPVHSTRQPEPS